MAKLLFLFTYLVVGPGSHSAPLFSSERTCLQLETIPIAEINAAPYNPRRDLQPEDQEYKLLAKGIAEFGLVEPLVWNKRTGNLVGGHQRLKVLAEQGASEVLCSVVDLPDGKEKQLNIALNKISGDWDMPRLKDLLEELDSGADDIEYTGFTEAEVAALMSQFHLPDSEPEYDESVADDVKKVICPECGHEFPL